MEVVGQYRSQATAFHFSLRLPWFVWMPLSMLAVITVITGSIALAAHRELSNPFAPYHDLLGDDARQAALSRGFTCQSSPSQITYDYCVQQQPSELFSRLSVRMSGDTANETVFSLRENTLTLGDLSALWGKPEIEQYCETMAASWPDRHIMGLVSQSPTGRIGYFSPIISVSFTSGSPSGWRQLLMNDALHNCGSSGGS